MWIVCPIPFFFSLSFCFCGSASARRFSLSGYTFRQLHKDIQNLAGFSLCHALVMIVIGLQRCPYCRVRLKHVCILFPQSVRILVEAALLCSRDSFLSLLYTQEVAVARDQPLADVCDLVNSQLHVSSSWCVLGSRLTLLRYMIPGVMSCQTPALGVAMYWGMPP
jgi:hypothetical protein